MIYGNIELKNTKAFEMIKTQIKRTNKIGLRKRIKNIR